MPSGSLAPLGLPLLRSGSLAEPGLPLLRSGSLQLIPSRGRCGGAVATVSLMGVGGVLVASLGRPWRLSGVFRGRVAFWIL
jgi:hypothetical protein